MFKTATLQLRRNRSHRPVSWLELFFDLIFVAAVAQVGEPLAHEFTPAGLFRYAFLFLLIWWSWLGNTMFSTRFESDDTLQRVLTFVQVFAAAVMAANAKEALSTRDAAGFGAAYALMRLVLVVQYLRGRKVKAARKLASLHAIGFGAAALLWFGAALLDTPERFNSGESLWPLILRRQCFRCITRTSFRRMRHIFRNGTGCSRLSLSASR
jgi:low temperature requirement protein LtrA